MPTNFRIDVSPEAKKLSQLTKDTNSDNYLYPATMNLPPVPPAIYKDLKDTFEKKKVAAKKQFDDLKAMLDKDAKATGDPAPKLRFNDVSMSIEIEYGFKECMDRFSEASKNKIREVLGITDTKKKHQDVFREKLATPELLAKYKDLKKDAYEDFRNDGYQDPTTDVDISGAKDSKAAVNTIFASQTGMCLDDNHSTPDGKEFLTNNMEELKKSQVQTLFIEHFWQEQQAMLDEYLNSADDAEMPKALEEAVTKLDAPFTGAKPPMPAQFKPLLAAAKKHKVRIVGLDTFEAKTPEDNDPRRWEDRAARFNAVAAEVVEREKGAGKFLLMAGAKHNNTHEGGIPGLGQLLGIHTFDPQGGKLAKRPEDTTKRGMRSEALQAFFDAFVDDFYKANPTWNREKVWEDAEKFARSQAATIDRMTPAQAAKMGAITSRHAVKQMKADKTEISTPVDGGKLKAAIEKGGSLLHLAAEENDLDVMTGLIAAGQSATAVDANGNTPLHRLIMDTNKDIAATSNLLLQSGASLATPNKAGETPLHRALGISYGKANMPFIGWMNNHGADFKTAAAVPKGGLRVIDMVMARGDSDVEDAMYANGTVVDTPLTVDGNAPKTTPEILAAATVCDDDSIKPKVLQQYQQLYDDFPEFRSTLDLAALTTLGDRKTNKALRLIMVNKDNPSSATTKGGYGAYDDSNGTLALGFDRPPKELLGTMIHELTHHAVNTLFENDTMPIPKTDVGNAIEKKYLSAIETDVKQSCMALTSSDQELQETLNGRIGGYLAKASGREKQRMRANQEFVVGIPQLLVTHGRDAIERRGGGLLGFWDEVLRPTAEQKINNHPEKAKIKPSTNPGKPYASDKPWGDNKLDPKKVAAAIMRQVNIENGCYSKQLSYEPGGVPPSDHESFLLPAARNIDTVEVADDADLPTLQKKLNGLISLLTYSKPGWYDGPRLKAEQALTLTDPKLLLAAIREVNKDITKGNAEAKTFRLERIKATKVLEEAVKQAVDSGKLPTEIHSGVLDAFVKKMAVQVGTGAVDENQLKIVAAKSTVELVASAKTAFGRKKAIDARADKKADLRHKMANKIAMTDEEFAEAIVLEAEARFYASNPSPDGVPMDVDTTKQKNLIKALVTALKKQPKRDGATFDKLVKTVQDNVLHKKGKKKIGKRDPAHVSIRKEWVKQLAKM